MGGMLATVHGYLLAVFNDIVIVKKDGKVVTRQEAKGLLQFVETAKTLRFGWGKFPDGGDEVLYLFDAADENFGYAVNLNDPHCSEWGYAPVQVKEEVAV